MNLKNNMLYLYKPANKADPQVQMILNLFLIMFSLYTGLSMLEAYFYSIYGRVEEKALEVLTSMD